MVVFTHLWERSDMDMEFTRFPELCKAGEFPWNPLHEELVQDAIYWYQTFGDDYGVCYKTIIDLCLAGF